MIDLGEQQADQDSSRATQGRTDEKSDHDDLVHVNAHHGCRLTVLGCGPHGLTQPGSPHQVVQTYHQQQGNDDNQDLGHRDSGPEGGHLPDAGDQQASAIGPVAGSHRQQYSILKEERNAQGADQGRDTRCLSEGTVSEPLNDDAQKAATQHGQG